MTLDLNAPSIGDPVWNSQIIQANGLNFHAVVHGEGPTVLLLHGFPENWYAWRYQIPALAEAGYKAVAVDLRGYNKTDRPENVRDYHVDRLCEDVDGLITALGDEPVHLVAHDWGGALAWIFASRFEHRLTTLQVLNAPHPKAFRKHLLTNPRQLARSWYMLFFQIPALPEWLFLRNVDQHSERTFRGWAIRKEPFTDEVIDAFKKPILQPGALRAGINYYRALFRDPTSFGQSARFPNLNLPTQVIWADEDRALGKELTDGLEDFFDGPFEIHHIPNCSHWVQQEQPEQVNELILDFLRRG
jgi:epoxide hydrolase 4